MPNLYREILTLAWPLIISNSFWNLQLTIDRIYIGAYSTEALGAVMAVMGVFWVPMALLQQTASYITTFVAQYSGAKQEEKIGVAVWQSIWVSVIGGLLFILLCFLSEDFFSFVGHSDVVRILEVEYFNSITYSALPVALVAAISGFYTGLGQTKTIIWINFIGLIMNVVLDYVFIFGHFGVPAMGVKGAGYATTLATYCAAFYGLYLILNEQSFKIKEAICFDLKQIKQFLKYGIPSGLQWAFEGLAFTCFLIIMGYTKQGEAALSSSSIAVSVMMLSILPSMGVAIAVMSLVGQSLGANDPEKAELVTWAAIRIVMIYMVSMAFTFFVFPEFYLSWFENKDNPDLWNQIKVLTPELLKVVGVFTLTDSLYLNLSFALKGAGDTRFVSFLALTLPWPLMVMPALYFKDFENAAILSWVSVAVYSFVLVFCLYVRFKKGKWKKMRVIN